jgi:hypothetical protein
MISERSVNIKPEHIGSCRRRCAPAALLDGRFVNVGSMAAMHREVPLLQRRDAEAAACVSTSKAAIWTSEGMPPPSGALLEGVPLGSRAMRGVRL